jgi:hypothetical protein
MNNSKRSTLMKNYFITYRRNGQSTRHTRPIQALTLLAAITELVADRESHGENITIMWAN